MRTEVDLLNITYNTLFTHLFILLTAIGYFPSFFFPQNGDGFTFRKDHYGILLEAETIIFLLLHGEKPRLVYDHRLQGNQKWKL